MDKFGKAIRKARDKRNESLDDLADAIHCSVMFARHIEHSKSVPVSPRLIANLSKHFGISLSSLAKLAESRNRVGKKYYREYNKKSRAS